MTNIFLMSGTRSFVETDVESSTIGELRDERNLGNSAINVNTVTASDSYELKDGDNVAVVKTTEKGG